MLLTIFFEKYDSKIREQNVGKIFRHGKKSWQKSSIRRTITDGTA